MHPVARLKDFERNFSRSVAHAGQIITDSEFIKAEVEALLGIASQRVAAVPLGVSASFFAARDRQADSEVIARLGLGNRRYALCVATLEPRKGLNHALRAFLAARERNGDLPCDCLVIVGAEGWKNNDLHTLIEPAVWSGRVVLPGYVAEADLLALYAQASLFLYPSAYEGFGLPPLEAMAMGVPTVVAPRASIPEVVGEWSLFAEPEDTDAFAEAILRGISDQAWRDAASCGGKTHAAQFTWERCVSSTIDVYRKALDCC
jgi:alpha-1,3-rhamnosyl/mannosyltransferase